MIAAFDPALPCLMNGASNVGAVDQHQRGESGESGESGALNGNVSLADSSRRCCGVGLQASPVGSRQLNCRARLKELDANHGGLCGRVIQRSGMLLLDLYQLFIHIPQSTPRFESG